MVSEERRTYDIDLLDVPEQATLPELTEEEWIARCRTAFRLGHTTRAKLRVLERWADLVCRLEGGQLDIVLQRLLEERRRTDGFQRNFHGANDSVGYGVVYLTSLLNYPCQKCAEDERKWHTRASFCRHGKSNG